jgi:hypothetical protein
MASIGKFPGRLDVPGNCYITQDNIASSDPFRIVCTSDNRILDKNVPKVNNPSSNFSFEKDEKGAILNQTPI